MATTTVDMPRLSAARTSQEDLTPPVAVIAIVVAAATNGFVKAAVAATAGGAANGVQVGLPLVAASSIGVVVVWLAPLLW